MKQEYIVAFMTKNSKRFRESDYATVQNALGNVDDSYFPLLMGKSFVKGWWIVLGILLLGLGIFLAIGCIAGGDAYFNNTHYVGTYPNGFWEHTYRTEDLLYSIFLGLMSVSSLFLGIYLQIVTRKKIALKDLQMFISLLK